MRQHIENDGVKAIERKKMNYKTNVLHLNHVGSERTYIYFDFFFPISTFSVFLSFFRIHQNKTEKVIFTIEWRCCPFRARHFVSAYIFVSREFASFSFFYFRAYARAHNETWKKIPRYRQKKCNEMMEVSTEGKQQNKRKVWEHGIFMFFYISNKFRTKNVDAIVHQMCELKNWGNRQYLFFFVWNEEVN